MSSIETSEPGGRGGGEGQIRNATTICKKHRECQRAAGGFFCWARPRRESRPTKRMEIWSSARTQKLWIDGTRRQMSGQCERMELLEVGFYGCAWHGRWAGLGAVRFLLPGSVRRCIRQVESRFGKPSHGAVGMGTEGRGDICQCAQARANEGMTGGRNGLPNGRSPQR